jgi:hypothetical protein
LIHICKQSTHQLAAAVLWGCSSGGPKQTTIPQTAPPRPQANGNSIGTLIAEAEALRATLHDAYVRSGKLLVAIRRKRKQTQVVQSTLAALKGLQHVDG